MRSILFILGLTTALSACQNAPKAAMIYDFGVTPVSAMSGMSATSGISRVSTAHLPPMLLAPVPTHAAFDSTGIFYRLGYHNAQQLLPYTQSHWTIPVTQLFHQRLRQHLGQNRPVLQATQGVMVATGTLRLHWEIEEFSQWFESPQHSKAIVRIVATMGRIKSGNKEELVAQRSFTAEHPAPTADAAGGVQALTQASDAVIAEIAQWAGSY